MQSIFYQHNKNDYFCPKYYYKNVKKIKLLRYFLLLLSVISCFTVNAQFSCKVEGTVKYNGKNLPGALVSLFNGVGKIKEVRTNDKGNYSLSLKPNDEYSIFVTKEGFTKMEIVFSTMGFTEEDAKAIKGSANPIVELFEMPTNENDAAQINEILSTPLMSYYYDYDKNEIVSDESLEESSKEELHKIEKIVKTSEKKEQPSDETDLNYKKEIAEGDKLFKSKEYELASLSYSQAMALKPTELYPKTKLSEIEKLMANAGEKERLAKEKELALAAEKERIAKEKASSEAAAKEKLAKEKELADAAEKERIAKAKAITDAKENERLEKEKTTTELAEKNRLAKEKELADIKEKERIANEKKLAEDTEKAKIAKEKAMVEKAETDRIAKEKAIADAAEKERLEKEKAIANAVEKERLEKEEAKRVLNKKYTLAINSGDSALIAKNYIVAKTAFEKALTIKPQELYPKERLTQIEVEIAKSGEFQNELAKKYPQGVTEEIVKEGNATDTRRIVVIGNKGTLYVMRRTTFGAVYYFKDGATITESVFNKDTENK